MIEELKECPFCVTNRFLFIVPSERGSFVKCRKCKCCGPLSKRYSDVEFQNEVAVELWNSRK